MIGKIANFIVSLFVFALMGLPLHEFWHYAAAYARGVTGYVAYPQLLGGVFQQVPATQTMYPDIYLAGGVGTALVFAALYWFAGHVGNRWDWDDLAGLGINGIVQLFYGLAEVSLFYSVATFNWLAPVAIAAGFLAGLVYYMPRLHRWWAEPEVTFGRET